MSIFSKAWDLRSHYASNYNTPSYGTDNHRLDGTGIIRHQIDFIRSPFKPANLKVYRQLRTLMEQESFQLVHCHTPMGGVMARLAAHATHTGPCNLYRPWFSLLLREQSPYTGSATTLWSVFCPATQISRFVSIMKIMNELKSLPRPIYRLHSRCGYRSLANSSFDRGRYQKEGRTWPSLRQAYTSFLR